MEKVDVKYFCDVCGKEMKSTDINNIFIIKEFQGDVKLQSTKDPKLVTPTISINDNKDFCSIECFLNYMKEKANELIYPKKHFR